MRRHVLRCLPAVAGLSPLFRASPAIAAGTGLAGTYADAYLWGYASVDLQAILARQALDPASPQFKAPLNRIGHARDVATPADTAVIAPNVDTPYSHAWLDLRAQPVVVTLPSFEPQRYVAMMLVDLYTYIVGYVSPRTNGQAGGDFLVAREGWTGTPPAGIAGVFRVPTDLSLAMVRTQLLGPDDLPRVHALQDRMRVRTLSEYLGRPTAAARPLPPWPTPLDLRAEPVSPRFFDVLGWMSAFMPVLPEDRAKRRAFEAAGLRPGRPFAPPDAAAGRAATQGMRDALARMGERAKRVRSSAELFGPRDRLKGDDLTRATGAMLGILGNSAQEYLGVGWQGDAQGRPFDGAHRYAIRFGPGELPPVGAFWSITAYTRERLLYANPLGRHVINAPMLPSLVRDADGGLTLHVQHASPGPEREANWLPVPATPFGLTFRTYLPGEAIRDGRWRAPPVNRLD